MTAIIPQPRTSISIRVATMDDLPFLDALQKKHSKQVGYFRTKVLEGYINAGWGLIAESVGGVVDPATPATASATPSTERVGYCFSRDKYLKREELGVIYHLC